MKTLATIVAIALMCTSHVLAADLKSFEGTWNGHWTRTSDPEKGSSGELVTTFAVRNNQLTGMHYGIEIEKVDVEGRTVIFQHKYGSCRATHTFTINLEDPNKADSTYQVENCPDKTLNHSGKITYTKSQ
jgi:hypothetical protein